MKINLIKAGLVIVLVLIFAGCGKASQEEMIPLMGEPVIIESESVPETSAHETSVQKEDPAEEHLTLLMQNLGAEEYVSEAVAQLCHPEWIQNMLPEGMQAKR